MFKLTRLSHNHPEAYLEDKVWFTYKARIQAHIRLSWLDFHSQMLMVWYALVGAGLGVISVRYPHQLGKNTDLVSALFSIALLSLSMAVANRDFRGRSIAMRQNYLDLQKLYEDLKLRGTFGAADLELYHRLLCEVENHKEIDDKIFRVRYHNTLSSRQPNWVETMEAYVNLGSRIALTVFLYVAPILIGWFA